MITVTSADVLLLMMKRLTLMAYESNGGSMQDKYDRITLTVENNLVSNDDNGIQMIL